MESNGGDPGGETLQRSCKEVGGKDLKKLENLAQKMMDLPPPPITPALAEANMSQKAHNREGYNKRVGMDSMGVPLGYSKQ
jgi:hypothetical protein